jgi:hypothetical protein
MELKKHVASVVFVEDISDDDEVGYFVVNFDEDGHGGGTYVYPATKELARKFKAGELEDEEFYGW